jgi:hypothetical protein
MSINAISSCEIYEQVAASRFALHEHFREGLSGFCFTGLLILFAAAWFLEKITALPSSHAPDFSSNNPLLRKEYP